MSEQNNTETTNDSETKTFTQEELDRIVSERLSRVKSQYADYEELKERANAVDDLNKTVEELTGKLQEAEAKAEESDKRATEAEVLSLRVKVSSEHGVPLKYLSADDEESLVEQAKELSEWKGATQGVKREADTSGNSSGPALDSKARAREALARL